LALAGQVGQVVLLQLVHLQEQAVAVLVDILVQVELVEMQEMLGLQVQAVAVAVEAGILLEQTLVEVVAQEYSEKAQVVVVAQLE
jgi:hypothetical protein